MIRSSRQGSGSGVRAVVLAVSLCAFAFCLPAAAAAAPANDDFADAQVMTGSPVTVTGTNVGATLQASEPEHGDSGGASVWYRWSPPTSGQAYIDTCGSEFDTMLAVYVGAGLGQLTRVAQDDDGACGSRSRVVFAATQGTQYMIAVDGFAGSRGAVRLTAGIHAPPANDDFANAQTVPAAGAVLTGTTDWGSLEQGEPDHAGAGGNTSVWYRWTPTTSGSATVDFCGGDSSLTAAVYRGSTLTGLSEVASGGCRLDFAIVAGTTYRIAMQGVYGEDGGFALEVAIRKTPANDDFANAQNLTGSSASVTGTTRWATRQAGEPMHGEGGEGSIWYRWVAPEDGNLFVDTCGSEIDTMLAVYSGSSLGTLTSLAQSDDGRCGLQSDVTLTVKRGVAYSIAIDGWEELGGAVKLALTFHAKPANDDFSDAQTLSGDDVTVNGTTAGAGTEAGEPSYGWSDAASSVWYRWTAPGDGRVTVSLCGQSFGSALRVFTGSSPGGLEEIAAGPCSVTFAATASVTYRIAVSSRFVSFGDFSLELRRQPAPANDRLSSAQALTGSDAERGGTIAGAGVEAGEPDHNGSGGDASVWYRWTAPADGGLAIDVCDNDFGSALAVYTGSQVGSLVKVGASECHLRLAVQAGTSYAIAVANGYWGSVGAFRLTLSYDPIPDNDSFASPRRLTGIQAQASGSTLAASREEGEPDHFEAGGDASVWFEWEAPTAGDLSVDVCGSPYETAIALYGGDGLDGLDELAAGQCEAGITVEAGDLVRIAVDGTDGARGRFSLRLDLDTTGKDLTVSRVGTGLGTVRSNGGEIDCGRRCDAEMARGAEITLVADPASNSTFVGWGGACSGEGECRVELDRSAEVTAEFAAAGSGWKPLSIRFGDAVLDLGTLDGIGLADESGPTGTLDGQLSAHGDIVGLADAFGFPPAQSSLESEGTGIDLTVEVGAAGEIGGSFGSENRAMVLRVPLTFRIEIPDVATCTYGPVDAELSTDGPDFEGPDGTLRAGPFKGGSGDQGALSASWDDLPNEAGACGYLAPIVGGPGAIWLRGTATGLPSAPAPRFALKINRTGAGSGTVASSPAGISCGASCTAEFDGGAGVTLTATPSAGSRFTGWSGACSGTQATCAVTMSQAREVTAAFAEIPVATPRHFLRVTRTGEGTVTSAPAGIDCGSVCEGTYDKGTVVTLTATPAAGAVFGGWSGACTGEQRTCSLTLGSDLAATATFRPQTTPTPTPPGTKVLSARVTRRKRMVRFTFNGSGGSGRLAFQCKMDRGPFVPCRSPKVYKRLRKGRHTFQVRARDAAGALDRSPAKRTFRI